MYTCTYTRCAHFEVLVAPITAENVLLNIQRFAARRGMPQKIHSDNFKSFLSAKNQFEQLEELDTILNSDKLRAKVARPPYHIEWTNSIPLSPWTNGIVEAIVKCFKNSFLKVFKNTQMSQQEVETIVANCEANVNSRPIMAISTDPHDITSLLVTPGHLLLGKPIRTMPSHFDHLRPGKNPNKISIRDIWKFRNSLTTQYCNAFRKYYINSLKRLTDDF